MNRTPGFIFENVGVILIGVNVIKVMIKLPLHLVLEQSVLERT